jgi:hypothetical protein
MAEVLFVANDNNMEGVTYQIYPTAEVTRDMWRELQAVHVESLQAQLPKQEWGRVDTITNATDLVTYANRRVHPNTQAGQDGWQEKQIFTRPRIAINRDSSNQIIGAALAANNSSGNSEKSKLAWEAEAWGKMIISPNLPIPKFGGRRYVHLREAYIHPDAQETIEVEDGTVAVSEITLMGIYHLLDKYNLRQQVAAYTAECDPADRDFEHLTQALGLSKTDHRENKLAGFSAATREIRAAWLVRDVMRTILDMPSAA